MNTLTIESLEPIASEQTMAKRQSSKKAGWRFWKWRIWRQKWFYIPALSLLVILVVAGIGLYITLRPMIAQAKVVQNKVEELKVAAKDQNLTSIKNGLPELQHELTALHQQTQLYSFTSGWPLIGNYYNDSQHAFDAAEAGLEGGKILIDALEPYAPVLGFKSDAATAVEKPNDERVADLVMLMPAILPALDEATVHFENTNTEIAKIDAQRYPQQIPFTEINVRQTIEEVQSQISGLEDGIHQARPILEILPGVLGAESNKRYLMIFQNDKELRPTGGFMTSIAYVTFQNGRFEVTESNDIYEIDNGQSYLPVPVPMTLYNNAGKLYLRDTNWSPDFVESMEDFELYYNNGGNPSVDGFFALDTQFVEELMKVTGPINVPGYGEFTAEPVDVNGSPVPKVIYELELIAQRSGLGGERKSVLGDLMKEMISKVMSEPVTKWPDYLELLIKMGQEKHVLLNFHDEQAQELAEENNFAGRIVDTKAPVDYLHINDANLAGLKTNFYLEQETKQEVTIAADGTVTKKLTITYTNTGQFDGWISATARNYTRVYVPLGSELISTTGGEQQVDAMEELGKTVFDNFVTIKPLQSQTMTFEYTLPFKITGSQYEEVIQKQPGAQNWKIATMVNGVAKDIVLDGDTTITLPVE